MIYSPHTLFVLRRSETRDQYNRVSSAGGEWECVGTCRCDDNSDVVISKVNAKEYVPLYHVVCPRTLKVSNGDMVRVMCGDRVRAEGKADRVRVLNCLDYTDFYVGL